jgi:hypothetical protein
VPLVVSIKVTFPFMQRGEEIEKPLLAVHWAIKPWAMHTKNNSEKTFKPFLIIVLPGSTN